MSAFLQLPRELRDIIYGYYLHCDGGYVHHAESQRFTQPNGDAICHALALACKQTASELQGLAFQLNTITFSATYSASMHERAELHHNVSFMYRSSKKALLERIAPKLFTREMAQAAAKAYPQFAGIIDIWMSQGDMRTLWEYDNSFGEAMSIWDDFVQCVLDLISEHPAYIETVKVLSPSVSGVERGRDPLQLKDAHLDPWLIVDLPDLKCMADVILSDTEKLHRFKKTFFAYSAAALALRFLALCTKETRASIRKIILEEDNVSVSQPECHGRGFIPFCQENTKLHVERRVSLWKTVFPARSRSRFDYMNSAEYSIENSRLENDRLLAVDVTRSVGSWVVEAMALPSLGMPDGSYSLILDGNPIPEHTARVFRIVQRDAAWQAALDVCYSRGMYPTTSWLQRRCHPSFTYDGLPHVIRTLSNEGSLIRCNFDPSPIVNIEEMLEERRRWFLDDWARNWPKHDPCEFQTEAPLPPWHVLRWRHVLL